METIRIRALMLATAFGVSALSAAGASATERGDKTMHAAMHKQHHRMHMEHNRSHSHMRMTHRMASAAARPMGMAKAARKSPGSCGTYMYWKAGVCVDARVTPAKKR